MDWQVGDLAVCVNADPHPQYGPVTLREGCVYRVAGVKPGLEFNSLVGRQCIGIYIAGNLSAAPAGSYVADRFRKIRPDEHQACEPEFVTLLKRAKRPVAA
jgi:hypothetical protein